MKEIKYTKKTLVKVPEGELKNVKAVQLVEFAINFFGHKETFTLDTKIDNNGVQSVIDGNGWIPAGHQIS